MNLLKFLSGVPAVKLYADDVFSSYNYTGTAASNTITNSINLSMYGGITWCKNRVTSATNYIIADTVQGVTKYLNSSSTGGTTTNAQTVTAFGTTGFTLGTDAQANTNTGSYLSWAFRKAPKFLDIVTYTGNGANRTINHNLSAVPGMIMIKRTDAAAAWKVYHRTLANTEYAVLNTTAAKVSDATMWNSTTATDTTFSLGTHADVNTNTATYIAYIFGHDTTSDGIVQCGTTTTGAGGAMTITGLGWEPQFIFHKSVSSVDYWYAHDVNRSVDDTNSKYIQVNSMNGEADGGPGNMAFTTDGFTTVNSGLYANAQTIMYMVIRRSHKPPTVGTQVFNTLLRAGTGAAVNVTGVGFPSDVVINSDRAYSISAAVSIFTRGLGGTNMQRVNSNIAEAADTSALTNFEIMDGFRVGDGTNGVVNNVGCATYANWCFKRAATFFETVRYVGTGANRTIAHNLAAVPELILIKNRTQGATPWKVYHKDLGAGNYLELNTTAISAADATAFNSTAPTSTVFSVGTSVYTNNNAIKFIAYLFASVAGISKVGSYTGNGSSQTINCAFTTGARFILIKRTSTAVGEWYVWDTARGIVAGNDPHIQVNSTATAEVTTDDSIDPDTSGFIVNQLAATNINVTASTYIFFAIA